MFIILHLRTFYNIFLVISFFFRDNLIIITLRSETVIDDQGHYSCLYLPIIRPDFVHIRTFLVNNNVKVEDIQNIHRVGQSNDPISFKNKNDAKSKVDHLLSKLL